MKKHLSPQERFWHKVNKTNSCWNWTASHRRDGYGQIAINGKPEAAHRFSYEIHFGKITDGLHVCHKCDNKSCVNPEHLFLGTNLDNMTDRVKKCLGYRKLSLQQVIDIRNEFKGIRGQRAELAKKYHVTCGNISAIVKRVTWQLF